MASYTLNFYRNKSASWTVPAITITEDIVCPEGMLARLSTEAPSLMRQTISGAEEDDVIIFTRNEMDMLPGVITITTSGDPYLLFLKFDISNTFIAMHEGCYRDLYRKSGSASKKNIPMYSKGPLGKGNYVYDRDTASFIAANPLVTELADRKTYDMNLVETPFQNKADAFVSYIETADIVFADYAITDKAIDIYINATISVAGLKLSWASDTNALFQQQNIGVKLGDESITGSFENNPVRYTGQRFVKSFKVPPQSRVATAIRLKIESDFVNNGYDDIEIHDINLLTEMLLGEISGGQNA